MRAPNNTALLLSLIAPLFTRLSRDEYECVLQSASRQDANAAAGRLSDGGLELPAWSDRAAFQDELLVSGMPFAAMPVESLYRPWSQAAGNQFGATRGLYMGDAAHHLRDLYAALEIEVPERFAAMPDHLSLELEFLALLLETGNEQGAREFVADHLSWLGEYDAVLADRVAAAQANRTLPDHRRAALAHGAAHLRALVAFAAGIASTLTDHVTTPAIPTTLRSE